MKNLSLALNGLLFVAVGVLYFWHFKSEKEPVEVEETLVVEEGVPETLQVEETTIETLTPDLPEINTGKVKIAFINLEELYKKYDFYKNGVNQLERSHNNKLEQLMKKQKQLEEDFQKYQQAAPTMSDTYRKTREEQLMQQEQELYKLKDKMEQDQNDEMTKFNQTLLKKLDDYLEDLSKKQHYTYVLTYMKGGPSSIVYANDSLEITNQVISGLNGLYHAKK